MRFLSIAGPISGIFVVQASPYGAIGFVTRSLLISLSLIRPHLLRRYFPVVEPQIPLMKLSFKKYAVQRLSDTGIATGAFTKYG